MTASRLGLIALTALALLLGIVIVIDAPPAAVSRSTRLWPGFAPHRATALAITRDGVTTELARDAAGWRVTAPSAAAGPAEPAVIADLLGALELASAARWVPLPEAERAGAAVTAPRLTVRARDDRDERWALDVGALAGTGQAWARLPGQGRAALIDAWVARALDRPTAALRVAAVVRTARPTAIELHAGGVDLLLSGTPLAIHLPGGKARLAPDRAAALIDALAALRIVELPAAPPGEPLGTLRVLGGAATDDLTDHGACPGAPTRRWIAGTAGSGCVELSAWTAVLDLARAITTDPRAAIDPRPLGPARVTRIERGPAVAEARGGGWRLTVDDAEVDADPDAIRGLLTALSGPGEVVALTGDPAATSRVVVHHVDDSIDDLARVTVAGAPALRRAGEPFAIRVAPDVLDRLDAPLVDTLVLVEEPWALRQIVLRDRRGETSLERGLTLEQWTAASGTARLDDLAALRALTAGLRADRLGGPAVTAPVRTLVLTFDPPPTRGDPAPIVHTIAVAAPGKDGRCRAMIDDQPALLPAAACRILLAPLTSARQARPR